MEIESVVHHDVEKNLILSLSLAKVTLGFTINILIASYNRKWTEKLINTDQNMEKSSPMCNLTMAARWLLSGLPLKIKFPHEALLDTYACIHFNPRVLK